MKNKLKISLALLTACALLFAAALPLTALAKSEGYAPRDGEIWDGSIASSFAGGSGTEEDPYLISNGAELAYLARQVMLITSYSGMYFALTDDIWLNDTSNWENWAPIYEEWQESPNSWITIGNKGMAKPFEGNFNGNGHTVYGLYTPKDGGAKGLFGYVRNASISNINTESGKIFGLSFCAGIVGYAENSEISDCINGVSVNAAPQDSYSSVYGSGGIVGYAQSSTIARCDNTGTDTSFRTQGVGGIAGKISDCIVTDCENHGIFDGYGCSYFGGIAGDALYGEIANCTNYGTPIDVAGFGGIAGKVVDGSIRDCVNRADFSFPASGIVDECAGTVEDCENFGRIISELGRSAGIVGDLVKLGDSTPTVENCRNRGEICGFKMAAGIVAFAYSDTVVANCENFAAIHAYADPYHVSEGGGICARADTVENCTNYGELQGAGDIYLGGICGTASNVINCENYGSVSVPEETGYAGGIAANNEYLIRECVNRGEVSGYNAGGIGCNQMTSSTIEDCANHGSVTGSMAGGIAGDNMGRVKRCFNTGDVSGFLTGGIVCYNTYAEATIEDCYNTGRVTGVESAAGIVGVISNDTPVRRCYNIGEISGEQSSGAVYGQLYSSECIADSCYYLEGCCENGGEGASALTAEQLMNEESYVGFDFETVWTMAGNSEYPYAELIGNPHGGGEPQPALTGDADGNGTVNIADGIIALRFTLELIDESAIVLENADVNGDGLISVADAILILRIALGM